MFVEVMETYSRSRRDKRPNSGGINPDRRLFERSLCDPGRQSWPTPDIIGVASTYKFSRYSSSPNSAGISPSRLLCEKSLVKILVSAMSNRNVRDDRKNVHFLDPPQGSNLTRNGASQGIAEEISMMGKRLAFIFTEVRTGNTYNTRRCTKWPTWCEMVPSNSLSERTLQQGK